MNLTGIAHQRYTSSIATEPKKYFRLDLSPAMGVVGTCSSKYYFEYSCTYYKSKWNILIFCSLKVSLL